MQIETTAKLELLRNNVARIVLITVVDGEEMRQQFMIGQAQLVKEYFDGEITLEEYKERSRKAAHFDKY